MPTSISIGFSQHSDPQEATLQACVHVKNHLNSIDTDLIIIFASPQYVVPEIQTIITRTLRPKHLVGSSTGGIILSNGVTNRGIAIVGINSTDMVFGVSAVRDIENQDVYAVGLDLAHKAIRDLNSSHREVFITFSQGIEKNCPQFIRGVKEALGIGFPVLGAVSSDDFKYKKLSQFFQDQILQNSAIGLLLGGTYPLAIGCKNGFKPLGKPRTITKVDGHIIHTIDNKPAVEIYKHFLGSEAEGLKDATLNSYAAMYPLGIYLEDSRQYLLRNIIDILADGSIVCHGGIPQGAEVHLMISNNESCQNSAIEAAELVKDSLADKQAKLILVFESLARHKILGRNAFSEIQAIKNVLGHTTPIVGMCSYGEIGPFNTLDNVKNIYLHNESILIIAIS
ncbi:MAG: FIST C-terminal domain-containing protein [Candidatus Omnitrophica bacterium]|nr:FIST C-terminal domain-containing protein [Candidatus Omnitrophota bacterium]